MDWVLVVAFVVSRRFGFSRYRRVVGRHTCVLHDVETSLHIYDIYLVSGKSRQVYEGRGIQD